MAARYDNRHRKLKTGEYQKENGDYLFRWTTRDGERHTVGATSLEELRRKKEEIARDKADGIKQCAKNVLMNDIFGLWKATKRGLKPNTYSNYVWCYEQYVWSDPVGQTPIQSLKRSDLKRFYNRLYEDRHLKISTIDNVHTVIHQVIQIAVDDNYIRKNISDNLLKELKQSHTVGESHKKALTVPEQNLFLDFIKPDSSRYNHWYNIFAVMLGTGMRVGECTGLRWQDIDLDNAMIDINHTLVYYRHSNGTNEKGNKCYFGINTLKTKAGCRKIPMQDYVKEAFIREQEYQKYNEISCQQEVDGYTDFIFVNRFGNCQHQGTLNKALRRIIRDCNDRQFDKGGNNPILLPNFSCHSLRHTFVTRLVEAEVSIPVIQKLAGHSSSDVTLDIYTTVTNEFKLREFDDFQAKMKIQDEEWHKSMLEQENSSRKNSKEEED
jgi:integrase